MGTVPSIKIQYQTDIALDDILTGMSNLGTNDLEQFLQKVGTMVAQRKSPHLSERETYLLTSINHAIPADLQYRYEEWAQKLNNETIAATEQTELLNAIEKLELKYSERLDYMLELANLKGISLDELTKQLKLHISGDA